MQWRDFASEVSGAVAGVNFISECGRMVAAVESLVDGKASDLWVVWDMRTKPPLQPFAPIKFRSLDAAQAAAESYTSSASVRVLLGLSKALAKGSTLAYGMAASVAIRRARGGEG